MRGEVRGEVRLIRLSVLVVCLIFAVAQALAHHSFAAEFDIAKPVTLKGVVTKVEFMNPHVWIYIDVTDDSGSVQHWQCESGAPNVLSRSGWRKDSLQAGEQVTIEGFRAKDGRNTANARLVTLPDGKKVFSGSAEDGGPGKPR